MEILSIRLIYILQLVLRLHLPPTLCSHIEGGPCKGGGHRFLSGQWQWKQQQNQGPPTPPFIYWRTQKQQQQHQRRRKNNQMDSADHPRRRRRGPGLPRMSLRRRRGSQPVLRGQGGRGGQSTCLPSTCPCWSAAAVVCMCVDQCLQMKATRKGGWYEGERGGFSRSYYK